MTKELNEIKEIVIRTETKVDSISKKLNRHDMTLFGDNGDGLKTRMSLAERSLGRNWKLLMGIYTVLVIAVIGTIVNYFAG